MDFTEELSQEKNPDIIRIGKYLWERAEKDPSVRKSLIKKNKSLKECFTYITNQARTQAQNGCAFVDDDTVYGWAVHYYDEDGDIEIKAMGSARDHVDEEHVPLEKKEEKQAKEKKKTRLAKRSKNDPVDGQMSLF